MAMGGGISPAYGGGNTFNFNQQFLKCKKIGSKRQKYVLCNAMRMKVFHFSAE
ncbi:MAG: hypothetical protein K2K57_08595 [Oscillospiraceae bacterium]|nr:hypothetical protein [Oscillospiraceae bacterium]